MGFRIDLLDPVTGLKTGSGPITSAAAVSRQQALDRIGKWSFNMAASDPALGEIEGKDFAVYWLQGGTVFSLGQCSYLGHQIQADGRTAAVTASSSLRDLQRQTVLQRSFDGATDDINDVLEAIVPMRAGWSLGQVDTVSKPAPLDFWYESIFDSVALLAQTFGLHFREGLTARTLDFGAFGTSSGVIAVGGERELPPAAYNNPDLCHITRLSVDYQAERVINRLVPFGGAVGVATIDLSLTTSTQVGYAVRSAALPGSGSYYYIQDGASIGLYGLSEVRFLRKDLRPISNSPAAREFAANVLYEAALASLLNLKDRQTIYELEVVGLQPDRARVGDKIRVRFLGVAETRRGAQAWLDLDQDFYILEMEEQFGAGLSTRLKINQNAVHEETVEDLLASTIRGFEQSQIHVQPTISRYTVGPYTKRVSTTVSANFSFKLGAETLTVWYVKIQIAGEPLKSSIQSIASESVTTPAGGGGTSAGGGSHSHTVEIPVFGGSAAVSYDVYWDADNSRFHLPSVGSGADSAAAGTSASQSNHSHTISDHTHTFTPALSVSYGIYEDSVRPNTLTIKVNGATVASGVTLSGPSYGYELDITSYILAAGNLQQEHTITVECGSNRGEIVFQAQVLAVIQGIAV